MKDFTITVHYGAVPFGVRVVAYDTLRSMRAAATRYDNRPRSRRKRLRGTFGDTLGLCHRFELCGSDGARKPLCAIVRLAEPHLGVGMVSHELAHAAVHIHELARGDRLTDTNDEDFCWVLGELVRATCLELWRDAGDVP